MTHRSLPLPLTISDTTLRDGAQMPGARFSVADKLAIAKALAAAGVDVIEAGFPAGSEHEIEAIRRIAAEVPGPLIMALCRTVPGDIDAAWRALAKVDPDRCGVGVFVGASPLHRRYKLGKTKAQCLELIAQCVVYARKRFARVTFSCEDGSRTEPAFLRQAYTAAMHYDAVFHFDQDAAKLELTLANIRNYFDGLPQEHFTAVLVVNGPGITCMPSSQTSQPSPQAPSVGDSQSSSTNRISCSLAEKPIAARLSK